MVQGQEITFVGTFVRRGSINAKGDYPIPDEVDFNLWSGPAPYTNPKLTRKRFHYDWHWQRHYGNGDSGLSGLARDLIRDGLDAADPTLDFSQFDLDGDGWIDAITFLHSGYGAEWGGTDSYGTNYVDRIWSHKWNLGTPWTSDEGIKVFDYNISPGLWSTSGSGPGRIGVVAHELGHFFGLPDLYDTNGTSHLLLFAPSSWSPETKRLIHSET